MNRQEIYRQIEEALGYVPTFFERLSDSSLESEWRIFYLKMKSRIS